MKHRLLKLGVFLLLGAIINVAVAWGFTLWRGGDGTENSMSQEDASRVWTENVPADWPSGPPNPAIAYESFRSRGQVLCLIGPDPSLGRSGPEEAWMLATFRCGWPMQSLQSTSLGHLPPPSWIHRTGWPLSPDIHTLPLGPIWPGFGINAVFYATMFWLLFAAPAFVRRRIRARRGQCPACAYPIGTSEVCTECGVPVTPKSVEPVT